MIFKGFGQWRCQFARVRAHELKGSGDIGNEKEKEGGMRKDLSEKWDIGQEKSEKMRDFYAVQHVLNKYSTKLHKF